MIKVAHWNINKWGVKNELPLKILENVKVLEIRQNDQDVLGE